MFFLQFAVITLLFVFSVRGDSATCLQAAPRDICQPLSGSVVLLDCTNETIITQQYDFILNNFLPKWSINPARLQFINSYGDHSSITLGAYKNHSDACNKVGAKEDYSLDNGGFHDYVSDGVGQQGIYGTRSRLIVFSSTTYAVDISETNPNYPEYAVVDLSGQGMWRSREDVSLLIEIDPKTLVNNDNLANCLVQFTCGVEFPSGCPGVSPDPRITVTKENPLIGEPHCTYNYETSWNDIMILFDSSSNVGANLLQQIVAQTKSEMAKFNIQKTSSTVQMSSRVGVIQYADTASVVNSLGSMDNSDFANFNIQYSNSAASNLEAAFESAQVEFHGFGSRSNSRKVIVVATANANSYNGVHATNFKNENGVIIVYDFSSTSNSVVTQVASPGYHILAADTLTLSDAICDANCYCPTAFSTEMVDAKRGFPLTGCYQAIKNPQNFQLATYSCKAKTNQTGFIATVKSQQKEDYIEKTLGKGTNVWIGATYDVGYQQFTWVDDNTKVSGYEPIAEPRLNGQNCIYINSGRWFRVDCRTSYQSLCETKPCSSDYMCQ